MDMRCRGEFTKERLRRERRCAWPIFGNGLVPNIERRCARRCLAMLSLLRRERRYVEGCLMVSADLLGAAFLAIGILPKASRRCARVVFAIGILQR